LLVICFINIHSWNGNREHIRPEKLFIFISRLQQILCEFDGLENFIDVIARAKNKVIELELSNGMIQQRMKYEGLVECYLRHVRRCMVEFIGADSTGATGAFAPVVEKVRGPTDMLAPVQFA
jgi:hypothetical protein